MRFEKILPNGRLWATVYEGEETNTLDATFSQWEDVAWLKSFFENNISDLSSYFHITDVNQAIYDTLDDNEKLQCLILDLSPEANLDELFRPLSNSQIGEILLGKEKARLRNRPKHASWLRIYAIKLSPGMFIVTGGAIKLTATMQEREHTLMQLARMEKVRNVLIEADVVDDAGFMEFVNE